MFITVSTDSIRVADAWERAPLDLIATLAAYPVALIGDIQNRMGMMASCLRPVTRKAALSGTILPVNTREGDNLAIHRALDEARPGDVLVVNGNAEINRSVFGDLLADICIAKGVVGVVIDGSVRDVEELEGLGLPVFARGVNPAGPTKTGPGTVGLPVACGNVVCNPGDVIIGDRDGLIVVSRNDLATFGTRIVEQEAFETSLRKRIRETALQR